jgi:pimeloyl-ACP methyl ester carboxylesterase
MGARIAAMQSFESDGVRIAYWDTGVGEPILLIHGFASAARFNWFEPGWVALLERSGRRVVAFDNRGHGNSDKPHAPPAYGTALMAEDARRLLDHLSIARADVMGYSMGARIGAFLAAEHPARVRSLVCGGLGSSLLAPMAGGEAIAQALEAPSIEEVADPAVRAYRAFAEKTASDLVALAALIRAVRDPLTPAMAHAIACPVLVAVGSDDHVAGSPQGLAQSLAHGEALVIPRRDHMQSVGDPVFKRGVLDFLGRRS